MSDTVGLVGHRETVDDAELVAVGDLD